MALTPQDIPQDIPCGPLSQTELDLINDWRVRVYNELVAFETRILSMEQAITNLFSTLPQIIQQEIGQRFFVQTVSNSNANKTITLPAGGTWVVMGVYLGTEETNGGYLASGRTYNDSDDDIVVATVAETRPGGYTYNISRNTNEKTTLAIFAYRTVG